MSKYYVRLMATCQNEDDDENCISADFCFLSEELYTEYADSLFDCLIEDFNSWLSNNGHEGWYVDDVIETERELCETEAMKPIMICK